jgi:hypothetical protein
VTDQILTHIAASPLEDLLASRGEVHRRSGKNNAERSFEKYLMDTERHLESRIAKIQTESLVLSTLVRHLTRHFGSLQKNRLCSKQRPLPTRDVSSPMANRHMQMQSSWV